MGNSSALAEKADDWKRAHAALTQLARQRAAADAEEGRWLLCAWRAAVHVHLGYGSFVEYVERLFGYRPRTTREKLRVAEALEMLPDAAQALASGTLNWSAAREITRVATPETERAWLGAARGKSIRELETLVSLRRLGDLPTSPPSPEPRTRVLRFEVAPETFATFREALQQLQRAAGGGLDEDALLLAMARHVLGGPANDGQSSYQISLSLCERCQAGEQMAAGERVPVDNDIVETARCDAQNIGPVVPPANENARGDGDREETAAHVGTRATQTTPPAVRRAVLIRDTHCCRVPGCRHSISVDVHHVIARAEGGTHDAENLITLCSAHHRAVHRGQLSIDRNDGTTLRFRHADGTPYGAELTPEIADAATKVFSALRHLGFNERESRAAIEPLLSDVELRGSPARLLREALCRVGAQGRS